MGKKIELKKIEDCKKSQVTFSKRRANLIKKMQEISINCDVDVAFLAFSSAGRVSKFCNCQRIEDLLYHYVNLPIEKRLSHIENIQEKMKRLREMGKIRYEEGYFCYLNNQIENLELQIKAYEREVQRIEADLRDFEVSSKEEATFHQLSCCETNLKQVIEKVKEKKREKLAMENEKGIPPLLNNEDVSSSLLLTGCSTSFKGQLHFFQSWRNKEYIFPKNVFDEMLGKDKGKAEEERHACVVASQMAALQLMTCDQLRDQTLVPWQQALGDFSPEKSNLVTRDFLCAFTENSNVEVRKNSSDDASNNYYLQEMSVTKNRSKPRDVNNNSSSGANNNNNVNINKDSEVTILSQPAAAIRFHDFFSSKNNLSSDG